MTTSWQPLSSATIIGSMPHRDRSRATDLILRLIPEVPVWPQLSSYPHEQMMVQYIEGLPGLALDAAGKAAVRTDGAGFERELLAFYEEYLEVESGAKPLEKSRFAMGPETGKSFFHFLDVLRGREVRPVAVKGQVVGPFTLLAGAKDQSGRALLYDDRFQDAVPKLLAMKARWQVEQLKAFGVPVIVFLDEPALAGFGSSAFISVTRELVQQVLKEAVDAIQAAGGLAGIHVCANTDWLLAFDANLDVINFDAYTYFERFSLYRREFTDFINRGGIVAWGMVPTLDPEAIRKETVESLALRWMDQAAVLVSAEAPMEKILARSLFTPSCGCGSISEELTERVLRLTADLSALMKARLSEFGRTTDIGR